MQRNSVRKKPKNILLVSVPGASVVKPSEQEKHFWKNYLTLLRIQDTYSISDEKFELVGNSIHQNVGLQHLGGLLKNRGHNVKYIAPGRDTQSENFAEEVLRNLNDVDFVLYSFHTCGAPLAENLAKRVKEKNPAIKNIAGGHHVSGLKQPPKNSAMDVFVLGRAHQSLPWLIEKNKVDSKLVVSAENVPKSFSKSECLFPFPNPDNSLMTIRDLPAARIYTQLGCGRIEPCVFCGSIIDHRKYLAGSIDSVFENIKDLVENFGTEFLYIGDEDFFRNPKHSAKIVQRLSKEYGKELRFSIQSSMDTIQENMWLLDKIAETKMCTEIQVGVESADEKIMKLLNKPVEIKTVKKIGKKIQSKGINFFGYWLSWLPGETIQSHNYTTKKICELLNGGGMDFAECTNVVPFQGTQLYEKRNQFGIEIIDWNLSHWRGENKPVFKFKKGPSREKMYQLYLKRVEKVAEIYEKRIGNLKLKTNLGIDPFKVMSGF